MNQPIGMIDSGVGGVSVLFEALRLLPEERFLFYGDNANAPYGDQPLERIQANTARCVEKLLFQGIKALLIACNTATSAYAAQLRATLSIPVIGMEPALKPASSLRHGGQVLVLATDATLHLEKFHRLMQLYGQGAVPVVGKGIVELVEAGKACSKEMEALLARLLEPYLRRQTDALVLGCTHYIFLQPLLERLLPGVPLVDGNLGTVRQLRRVLCQQGLLAPEGSKGGYTLMSSGGPEYTCLMERLLRSLDPATPSADEACADALRQERTK